MLEENYWEGEAMRYDEHHKASHLLSVS